MGFVPDGKYVLTCSNDRTARLWDTSSGKELISLQGHTDWVRRGAFSPDGKYVLTGSNDQTARLWDTSSGKALTSLDRKSGVEGKVVDLGGRRIVHTNYIESAAR